MNELKLTPNEREFVRINVRFILDESDELQRLTQLINRVRTREKRKPLSEKTVLDDFLGNKTSAMPTPRPQK